MLSVAKAALTDVATAYRIVVGEVPVPVVPGLSEAEDRLRLASEVLVGVGTVLNAAVEVMGRAEALVASMVAVPEPALRLAEEPVEDREPFGFAAYHWRRQPLIGKEERLAA